MIEQITLKGMMPSIADQTLRGAVNELIAWTDEPYSDDDLQEIADKVGAQVADLIDVPDVEEIERRLQALETIEKSPVSWGVEVLQCQVQSAEGWTDHYREIANEKTAEVADLRKQNKFLRSSLDSWSTTYRTDSVEKDHLRSEVYNLRAQKTRKRFWVVAACGMTLFSAAQTAFTLLI